MQEVFCGFVSNSCSGIFARKSPLAFFIVDFIMYGLNATILLVFSVIYTVKYVRDNVQSTSHRKTLQADLKTQSCMLKPFFFAIMTGWLHIILPWLLAEWINKMGCKIWIFKLFIFLGDTGQLYRNCLTRMLWVKGHFFQPYVSQNLYWDMSQCFCDHIMEVNGDQWVRLLTSKACPWCSSEKWKSYRFELTYCKGE